MSKQNRRRNLLDRIRDILAELDRWLAPQQPQPVPVPVRVPKDRH